MATFISFANLIAERKASTAGNSPLILSSFNLPPLAVAGNITAPTSPLAD
jgi:hypothetical protein